VHAGSRRTRPLPLIVLALATAGAIVAGILLVGPAGASSSGTEIRLATVGRSVVQSTVSTSGSLEPISEVGLNFKASEILRGLVMSL
jgi:multidrug efflux pump subunit AcrA (membrane-fusion protein)